MEALQGGEAKEDVDSGRKLNATWHNVTVQKCGNDELRMER